MTPLDSVIEKIEIARLSVDSKLIVKLVAISKYTTNDKIENLYKQGQRAFGESRVQDLQIKQKELESLPLEWHFIGRLQTNKINPLIEFEPALFHALNSLELAHELDKRLKIKNKKLKCLLQINSAKEKSKAGVMPEVAQETYHQIREQYSNIELTGLMSIGAYTEDEKIIQKSFETTKKIYDKCSGANTLSMGMSGDFELAIRCGSNMVRIGSMLFNK